MIREAHEWFEELEEAYSRMRAKEIRILDRIRAIVDPFTETDTRCIYEFIKQTTPQLVVFKGELLSRQLQGLVPQTTTSL